MGHYRLTFWIWTFLRFYWIYIWSESPWNPDFNGKIRFYKGWAFFWFFINFTIQRWLTLAAISTIWSNVIWYLIVLYESSGSQLAGPSEFDWFHLHYDRKSYRTLVKICLFGISRTIKRWWFGNIWLKYQYMNKYFRDKWWFLIF